MPIHYQDTFWDTCWATRRGADQALRGAILAAGLGRRLDPLSTYHIPKPLFPLGGKVPIAELWLRRMLESGIVDISMNVSVLGNSIVRHFEDGRRFGVKLDFIEEEVPTGTLGAVCKQTLGPEARTLHPAEDLSHLTPFSGTTVLAPSGDIVTNFDVEQLEQMFDIHRRMGAAFTMVVTPVPMARRKDFGTVVLDRSETHGGPISSFGPVAEFREKDPDSPSNLNNASIYMIETEFLRALDPLRTAARVDLDEPFYDFGKHVFPAMGGKLPYVQGLEKYPLWAIQYDGGWFDVGNKRDYLKVNEYLLAGNLDVPLPYGRLPWGFLGTNVTIDFSKVEIHPPVVIGNDCIIEPDTVLGPFAIIGDGWRVERGCRIEHSVLWERYSYFPEGGEEIPSREYRTVDRHEVRNGVTVSESIIASGTVTTDVTAKTVHVREDGSLDIKPIDYVPDGPRA